MKSNRWGLIDNFIADDRQTIGIVAFAEKGMNSTWDVSPVQDAWRDARRVKQYNDNLGRLIRHSRPHLSLTCDDVTPLSPNTNPHNYHYIGHF
jgi:hypothetical protein